MSGAVQERVRLEPSPPRRHRRRTAVVVVSCLLTLVLVPTGVALFLVHRVTDQVAHVHGVFDGLPDRPAPATAAEDGETPVNILVLGTDRRSDVPTTGAEARDPSWRPGAQRSDTMMVVHLDGDRRHASVISIPRDSWVQVPGHGSAKVNAAYSYGGPRLAVQTVEQMTDVRIDHLAVIDFDGFADLIDALGGVDVTVPSTVHDAYRDRTWSAGTHHLRGPDALLYTRERDGLPGGDLDRVKRQQAVLRALSSGALKSTGSPTKTYGLLDVTARHLTVDDEWGTADMAQLALSLRHLRTADVDYLTIPVAGTGRAGRASVVFLDHEADNALWASVQSDDVRTWASAHPDLLTGATVR